MKLFKRKQRRHRSSAKDKAEIEKAKVEAMLAKVWLQDLKDHPGYAREIARQRFGINPEPEPNVDGGGAEPPDLLETLRVAKEVREMVKDEVTDKGGGWSGVIQELVKYLPQFLGALSKAQQSQTVVVERPEQAVATRTIIPPQVKVPEPVKIETVKPKEPPPVESVVNLSDVESQPKENEMVQFTKRLLELSPEQAAVALYEFRDKPEDARSIVWEYLSSTDLDSILTQIPTLRSYPELKDFLPLLDRLNTAQGRQWISLLIDEVSLINQGVKTPKENGNERERH